MDRQGQGAYIPQELLKELSKASNRLLIGIPCERVEGERRLALTIWADFLVRCKEGDPPPTLQTSNIVPFKRVARQRHRCTPVPQPE